MQQKNLRNTDPEQMEVQQLIISTYTLSLSESEISSVHNVFDKNIS